MLRNSAVELLYFRDSELQLVFQTANQRRPKITDSLKHLRKSSQAILFVKLIKLSV